MRTKIRKCLREGQWIRRKCLLLAVILLVCNRCPVYAEDDVLLELHNRKTVDNVTFAVENMLPGDSVSGTYCVRVSVKRLPVDEQLKVQFHADIAPGCEKLAEVLKCRVILEDTREILYEGLMKDMPLSVDCSMDAAVGQKDLVYEITAYLDTDVGNAYMGQKLSADFRWWLKYEESPAESTEGENDSADNAGGTVVTGDSSQAEVWILGMVLSMLCCVYFLFFQAKRSASVKAQKRGEKWIE